jgi:hypothetical protein
MEKIIHHEDKPKRPIGQKRRPINMSDYEVSDEVAFRLKRMGVQDVYG